jgi:hypothetical protein
MTDTRCNGAKHRRRFRQASVSFLTVRIFKRNVGPLQAFTKLVIYEHRGEQCQRTKAARIEGMLTFCHRHNRCK